MIIASYCMRFLSGNPLFKYACKDTCALIKPLLIIKNKKNYLSIS